MKHIARWLGFMAAILLVSACAGAPVLGLAQISQGQSSGLGSGVAQMLGEKPSGKIAYSRAGAVWMIDNGSETQLTKPPEGATDIQPAWSPDGTKLAFVRKGDAYSDIYVLQLSDMSETALTSNRSDATPESLTYVQQCNWAFRPTWSPDGTQIAYLSDVYTFDMALWLMSASGEGAHQISKLPDQMGGLDCPRWSPDGNSIVAASFSSGTQQVWSVDLATGKWTELTTGDNPSYDPALSPDGASLAYTVRSGQRNDVWVMDLSTLHPFALTDQGMARAPEWSPTGNEIAYVAETNNNFDIWIAQVPANEDTTNIQQYRLTNGESVDATSGLSWTK